ncbi:acyltransferase [uncultured Fibrobacter sp.]|uniref:acyltransferase family protein n=1 Tax=uncultured Fibrobacter sp. TaxID=261512 RepID=UPI0026324508|nr:acyltransferase [uncultured Fibrobacter sp.]
MLVDVEIVFIIIVLLLMFRKKDGLAESSLPIAKDVNSFISKETSAFFKAFCCVIIVLHHFSLRYENGGLISSLVAVGGGSFSLPIFFLLSSYGVVKSEYRCRTNAILFVKKRLLKIMIPFWIICSVTVLTYSMISLEGVTQSELAAYRVNSYFGFMAGIPLIQKLGMCLGLIEIDGAMWFIWVTVVSYIAILISKSIFRLDKFPIGFFALYVALIVFSGVCFFIFELPAHYWRNLWALILGGGLAVLDIKSVRMTKMFLLAVCFITNVYLCIYSVYMHDYVYMVFANMALISIFIVNELLKKKLEFHSVITVLSGLSYWIYLIHIKVLTFEWYFVGYKDVFVPLFVIITMSFLFSKLLKSNRGCINEIRIL